MWAKETSLYGEELNKNIVIQLYPHVWIVKKKIYIIRRAKNGTVWKNSELSMIGEFNFLNESIQEIKSLFEKQTERNPNSIAVKYQSKEITYNELNQRANQLAHKLLSIKNIKSNKLIPILLDRNEYMIIGLLGVLKAGAAYVPIDSNLPDERIKYILAETNSDILITLDKYLHRVSSIDSSLDIISIDLETSPLNKDSNPEIIIEDDSLAYVIFTSGTTGTPKGVMVEHKSVINLISLNLPIINLASQSKKFNCLFFSNYSFDAHVWEVFSCLLNGHTLCIPENFIRYDIRALKKYIEDNHINIALIPPALLDPDILLNVDLLVVGGEKISQSVLQSYLNAKINVLNAYGPTEATVISSYHLFRETSEYNNIGLPINNTHYYVLDKHLELAKNEEIGELYIGGLGLAKGYVQNTALHKSSFIEHPSLGRLYKTGDLIRVTVDGAYEYIGRSDRQVKIRSHRIELGEIESVIHLFPGINHCIVITDSILEKTNHPSSLILAYFVSDIEIDQQQLKLFVQNQLPHYMLPNQFIRLEKFPLTLNGKIDISVLPMLHSIKEDKETPRNEFDIGILNIWSQVLGINSNLIGISDDFFYLGGNSILAIKLVKELNEQLNLNINVVELFELSNIKNISDKSQFKSNLLCNKHFDSHQISPSERLILRDYFSTEYKNIYNENFVIEINHELDKINYEKAIAYLFDEFDILHTNYLNSDGFFSRLENTQVPPVFEFIDLSQDKAAEKTYLNFINNAVIQPFHIEKDKLIRFYLFKFSQSQFKLFIVLFHAILDGTSVINILLPKLYLYLTKEIEPSKFLLSDYHSFSNKIQQVYEDNQQTKLAYWARRFSEAEPWNYIPSHSHQDISTGRQIKFLINEHITQSLNYLTHRLSTSLFDILSGCFVLVLNKFSQQNNLTIRTNIDERLYAPEFIDTPGCFINNLFLSVNLKSTWTLEDLIIAIKESKKESMANLVDYDTLLSNFREKIIDLSRVHFNIEPEPYVQQDYYQSQVQTHSGEIKNDLYFELDIKTDHILGRVEYKSSIFKQKEIDTLISSFQNLLLNIDELIQTKIININLLSDLQLNTILNEFNRNYISYSNVKTLVKTFESQVQRNPDGIAISHGKLKYTYQELNKKSNQFAHYL
ncbi:non-ribosomal peptide synthetase, partial [Legionella sp. km535]|uniref:non-ribosomal peptide synthetase n=1 Tax=Legionella sp. km535 TaxID=2498107 RepID=UPI000FB809C0